MQRTELSFQEIYNQLLAGKKLALHFPDAALAENFRTRLHHHKQKQEKTFQSLGLQVEDERTVLSFKTKKNEQGEDIVAYVQFALPSPLKKYPVIIIEDQDFGHGAQISASVG